MEEIYYVMNGEGVAHVGSESTPVHAGDAVPVRFSEVHSFEGAASSDLELMVIGIARIRFALDTQLVK